MRAAGLHAIATLMQSQAVLITPSKPHASLTPQLAPLINLVKSRIAGVIAAKQYVLCNYNIHQDKLTDAIAVTPGRRAATVSKLETEGWLAVSAMVERKKMADIMDKLSETGAEDILILTLDNCRVGV
jgi:ATP phosphoribosyltransferase